ncbi:hypothetical protein AQUCO_04700015v1 [Aquilegia coerulea]|uniref:Receptor-like serine/threonine-protein kinase n=1 Tax=Aquilegia coerulea TaxID=218851 RepID=A0A2G5CKR8_AQUCA|nr:hypothetical protein AQUCO_04700015v1 [Aquilegia coerulea]
MTTTTCILNLSKSKLAECCMCNQKCFAKAVHGSPYTAIILNTARKPSIGFGFVSSSESSFFYLVIFATEEKVTRLNVTTTRINLTVLWSANRDNAVKENATVEFDSHGDLILKEADGTFIWSTNTSGKSIVGMRIVETGNLLLHDANNKTVWSSFDHPMADTWLPGQILVHGQRITARVSPNNLTSGVFYLSVQHNGFYACIKADPPQVYNTIFHDGYRSLGASSTSGSQFNLNYGMTGSLSSVNYSTGKDKEFQYMRLDSDGHLRVYQWYDASETLFTDVLTGKLGDCGYPTVCGEYGICSNGQCSCPISADGDPRYFRQINQIRPNLGCREETQLSCNSSALHYLELEYVSYFNNANVMVNTDVENCKQACMKNCSCKAVEFRYYGNASNGNCSLPSHIFSLMANKEDILGYKSTTFLKVQNPFPALDPKPSTRLIVGSLFGTLFVVFLIGLCVVVFRKIKHIEAEENDPYDEENVLLEQTSEMPKRFSYEDLKSATRNFQKRIGGGGFGSVYDGILDNVTIAVKRLDDLGHGQGRKEFLAEVQTIGSIHHVNLVKLVGFCTENSHKLLAYEYMCNGSLDKWIFHRDQESTLDWRTRRKVILDVAKGLSYLHEDCRKKIIHLDIKPQNILLDSEFNAKVSDFGLARFIDRDECQVLTMMTGTRGYLAPEWLLNRRISEKVDVYSFGVVVLETMCGRRNLDYSLSEEDEYLLHLVKRKAEDDTLYDIVDKQSEDMQHHREEAVKMIRTAIWCLQGDCTRRPSMSMVVKVLEGVMDMENISDYSFLRLTPMVLSMEVDASASASLLASILSEPR